jgi:hypothetical protein
MEECVHRTWMPPLPGEIIRDTTTEQKQWQSSKKKFNIFFIDEILHYFSHNNIT